MLLITGCWGQFVFAQSFIFLISMQSGQLNETTCFCSPHTKSSVVLIIAPKIYNDKTDVIAIFNPSQVLFCYITGRIVSMCMREKDIDCKVLQLSQCHQQCEENHWRKIDISEAGYKMYLGAALWVAGGWSHGLQNGDNITGNVTGWVIGAKHPAL